MRKPSVGTAHILNVNVRKNSGFVDVGMQEEMGHFFGGNIKFFTLCSALRLSLPYATKYYTSPMTLADSIDYIRGGNGNYTRDVMTNRVTE